MSPAFGSSARVLAKRSTAPSRVSSVTVDAGEEEGEAVDSDITPHESECRTVSLKERNRLPPLHYALCGSNVCECMCPSMHTLRNHRSRHLARSQESRISFSGKTSCSQERDATTQKAIGWNRIQA